MIKAELLEALPKLNAEERREIRDKLNELDSEVRFDNGELSEQEKAIIEARIGENPFAFPVILRIGSDACCFV